MAQRFVSEAITPVPGTIEAHEMAVGEPGLPRRFFWRDREYEIAEVLETWKTTSPDRGEQYVRRHGYRILTTDDLEMRIYFQRQDRQWWLYTVSRPDEPTP